MAENHPPMPFKIQMSKLVALGITLSGNSDHPAKSVLECADEAAKRSGYLTTGSTVYSWAREVEPLNFRCLLNVF